MHSLLPTTGTTVFHFISFLLIAVATTVRAAKGTVWATPHESYSSSIGVLGCHINTNRVAYWPNSVDCNNICVSLSYGERSVKLLRIDQSQGAHDVSYDAWNYLYTGFSATEKPTAGGATPMEYEELPASECRDLIKTKDGKLPLSAANSMNFLSSCMAKDTWVGKNHLLYNILDPICSWGYDETCELDWASGANQAKCPHQLGTPTALTSVPVYNIQYNTGRRVLASTNQVVDGGEVKNVATNLKTMNDASLGSGRSFMMMLGLLTFWLAYRM
ncbi:hypothetical protein QBC35DRAFT_505817 [Podospora australis]|uniref:Cerato-platanin n=1 Tax=Podospora australis TaxID=1536484 RepID=A0AAN6WND5_9PEZI|nr:hypothetical protein QBC35DRAFT_505817 [Podospora australis]